jgi:hypothetical protein
MKVFETTSNVINDELVDYGNIEYEDIETEVDPATNTGC